MSKTITIRIDEEVYELFKKAAAGQKRTISNFIEFAALNYLVDDIYVDDAEMENILHSDNELKKGIDDVLKGRYHIVK